jgi:hypothetical protein
MGLRLTTAVSRFSTAIDLGSDFFGATSGARSRNDSMGVTMFMPDQAIFLTLRRSIVFRG